MTPSNRLDLLAARRFPPFLHLMLPSFWPSASSVPGVAQLLQDSRRVVRHMSICHYWSLFSQLFGSFQSFRKQATVLLLDFLCLRPLKGSFLISVSLVLPQLSSGKETVFPRLFCLYPFMLPYSNFFLPRFDSLMICCSKFFEPGSPLPSSAVLLPAFSFSRFFKGPACQ